MYRIAVLGYGLANYVLFLGVLVYSIGFMGNVAVPISLDSHARTSWAAALTIDLALLAVFAIQHSGMARPTFKRWWTRYIPDPIERSTYVLCSNLALILFFWQWQPIRGTVWRVESNAARAALYCLFAAGCLTILVSTFLINHFELFGLRQAWLYFRGRPHEPPKFQSPGLYKYVRHPLYVGWLLVFWSAPTMTAAHLLFAAATTAYILIAIQLEERNLTDLLPGYADYRNRVPMLIPRWPQTTRNAAGAQSTSDVA